MAAARQLFTPVRLGELELAHRVVLAPLTRQRASRDSLVPGSLAEAYYAQRATPGGLLITEATCISSEAILDHGVPGLWSEAQVAGWRQVTQAVHRKGGLVVCQLWHTGRVAHGSFKDHPAVVDGRAPTVSASDVTYEAQTRSTLSGDKLPYNQPRALRPDEMPRLIDDYRKAARNAKLAGFDGVELHAAHGYLLDQFLNDGTNRRMDRYGGSIENRCRLMHEVLDALGESFSFARIGVRLSPHSDKTIKYYGTTDSDPDALYAHAVQSLSRYGLAYLLLTEPRWFGGAHDTDFSKDPGLAMGLVNPAKFRNLYTGGALMGAGGFTPASAEQALRDGSYDVIGFGR
jgi:N-ethylmaleimide reductase